MKNPDKFTEMLYLLIAFVGMLLVFVLMMMMTGCHKNKFQESEERNQRIGEKKDDYCENSKLLEDEYGFIGPCGDQVLFNSLRSVSCETDTQIYRAENPQKPGEWFRDGARSCKIPEQTQTQFSRDMAIGLMLYLWQQNDAEALRVTEDLISYVKDQGWYLCEAREPLRTSRCYVNPQLRGTMYELLYRLGGEDNSLRKTIFIPSLDVTGFEAHLQVQHILLRGLLRGSISDLEKVSLKKQKTRQPKNLLFRTVYEKFNKGEMDGIVEDLDEMDDKFPDNRLPSSQDRCEPYLWQRDSASDSWLPCVREQNTHPGIDYAFLAALINDKVRHSYLFNVPEGEFPYKERK